MDSRVFIIGRDVVPQYIRLAQGESLRWTLVFLRNPSAHLGFSTPSVPLSGGRLEPASGPHEGNGGAAVGVPPAAHATLGNVRGGTACGGVGEADGGRGELQQPQPTVVPIEIDIDGEGCEVDLAGLYICPEDEDVSFRIMVKHNSGGSLSRQLFKGIAGGKARAEFDGLIYVKKDAQKTKAYQANHVILLSDTAHVETRPQLEIYADDVECSHGATTGFLNPDELFYMRSRGIPEAEARRLQMISFLSPVLDRLPEELREEVLARL